MILTKQKLLEIIQVDFKGMRMETARHYLSAFLESGILDAADFETLRLNGVFQ